MMNNEISFSGNIILVENHSISAAYPVAEAFQLGDKIVVLYDPDAYQENFGQFKNLVALTLEGETFWTAELPTNDSGDRYYKVSSKKPLIAYSIYSYACEIDESNGKIVSRTFFK